MLGVLFSIIPMAHFVAFGYFYRLFLQGKRQEEISLPEWSDSKGLFVDGLKCFLVVFLFAFIPIAVISALVSFSLGFFSCLVCASPRIFFARGLKLFCPISYTLTGILELF